MYTAYLTLTGMMAVPASPRTVTLTGSSGSDFAMAGTRDGTMTLDGKQASAMTLDASLDLTPLGG